MDSFLAAMNAPLLENVLQGQLQRALTASQMMNAHVIEQVRARRSQELGDIPLPEDIDDLPGFLGDLLPEECSVDDLCDIYQDVRGLLTSDTCQSALGLNLPSEIDRVLTVGLDCINVALCSRGSAQRCIENVLDIATDPEFQENLENFELDIDLDNPLDLLPTMCRNGCYDRISNIVTGLYDASQANPECIEALSEEELPDMGGNFPEVPESPTDIDLGLGLDLDEVLGDVVDLLANGCQRNDNGDYCVVLIADALFTDDDDDRRLQGISLPIDEEFPEFPDPYSEGDDDFSIDCPPENESEEVCPIMRELGCCGSIILSSPFFSVDAVTSSCIINYANNICDVSNLQRPCTDGVTTPVAVVTTETSLPETAVVDEATFAAAIATSTGVPESSIIITSVTTNEDGSQTVAFEVILRGSMADDSSAVVESINDPTGSFNEAIANAVGLENANDVTTEPPMTENIGGGSDGGDDSNIAIIAGAAAGAAVVAGLVVAGVMVGRARRNQQSTQRNQGIDMPDSSVKNPSRLDV